QPLFEADSIALPRFLPGLACMTDEQESLACRSYGAGLRESDPVARASALGISAAICPVVPEPCIWQAHLALCRGDVVTARAWARAGRERLDGLGTVWDKRLSFDEWLGVAAALERRPPPESTAVHDVISDPRGLHELAVAQAGSPASVPARPERRRIERFH